MMSQFLISKSLQHPYSYVQTEAVIISNTVTSRPRGDKKLISPADYYALLAISIPTHIVPRMS
jgi:hypothetical protein